MGGDGDLADPVGDLFHRLANQQAPPKMQEGYKLMAVKCTKCHSQERTAIALQTGIAPITGCLRHRSAIQLRSSRQVR